MIHRRLLLALFLSASSFIGLKAAVRPISKEALAAALGRGGLPAAELASTIRMTGVSFALSPADEQSLQNLGAAPEVLDAVRSSRVSGGVRNAAKPLAPVEFVLKLFHATPVAAAAALKTRGAGFDLTPALEAQILEAGGDKSLLALAVLRRLTVEPVAAQPVPAAVESKPGPSMPAGPAAQLASDAGAPRAIRVDPASQAKKLLRKPLPEYPQMAYRARMDGQVEVEVLIGRDGRVRRARVLRGHEIFRDAAVQAAEQYVYKPTMLDDTAVEVVSEIVVPFDLSKADLGMKN